MSRFNAWKAFRMGVIASLTPVKADAAFMKVMRKRFDQWFADYERGHARRSAGEFEPKKPSNTPRRKS